MAKTPQRELPSALAASFGPGRLRAGREEDSVDGIIPRYVATPRSSEDVAAILRAARESRLSVITAGGGTTIDTGNLPTSFDLRLSTRGLSTILDRQPEDMTVTVQPGVTLSRLNAILAADRQRVALDAGEPQRATVGGRVATDTAGGLANSFGRPRDLVLGMTMVDGQARTLRVGGRVVKNVAGYDLVRLFTGSYGTLGVITEITLRTHPCPDALSTVVVRFPRAAELDKARAAVFRSELPLAAFDFAVEESNHTTSWLLIARIEGTDRELDYQRHRLVELCARPAAAETTDWVSPSHPRSTDDFVVRIGCQPDQVLPLADAAWRRTRDMRAYIGGRLGDGTFRVGYSCPDACYALKVALSLRETANAMGARAVFERLDAEMKPSVDVWGDAPSGFEIMHAIKQRFDPLAILSPGRFVGRL